METHIEYVGAHRLGSWVPLCGQSAAPRSLITDRTWIEKYNIHLVVHGDDYSQETLAHIYKVPIEMGIFRVIPYTPGISTSEIIRRCKQAKLN